MQYPLTIRYPKITYTSELYKHKILSKWFEIFGSSGDYVDYVYSYNAYCEPLKPYCLTPINEHLHHHIFTIAVVSDNCNNIIIVINSDADNVDYFKFILSHITIEMALRKYSRRNDGYYTTRLMCAIIGNKVNEWYSISREYTKVRKQLILSKTKEECNELWHKYFMYNNQSRTPEYLNEVMDIDKTLSSYLLPPVLYLYNGEDISQSLVNPYHISLCKFKDMSDEDFFKYYSIDQDKRNELNTKIISTFDN